LDFRGESGVVVELDGFCDAMVVLASVVVRLACIVSLGGVQQGRCWAVHTGRGTARQGQVNCNCTDVFCFRYVARPRLAATYRRFGTLLLSVDPAESRRPHGSLSRLIVLNPVLVPPLASRGAPRQMALETSTSERRK
jgi:hypothetical protein